MKFSYLNTRWSPEVDSSCGSESAKKKLLIHWRFSAMALPAIMVTVGAKLKKSKVLEYWLNDNYNWFCEKREK